MNNRYLIFSVLGIIIILSLYGFYFIKSPDILNLKPKLGPDSNLLFIGSSSVNDPNSFADQLQIMYPDLGITKIAQDGAQTSWMYSNAISDIEGGNFDGIFIFGGLNDIYATGTIESAKTNLQALYDKSKAAGAITIAITLQPTDNYASFTQTKGNLTLDLNEWIEDNSTPDIIIDLYGFLIDYQGNQNTDFFKTDYLHLNYEGQNMLADEISATIF